MASKKVSSRNRAAQWQYSRRKDFERGQQDAARKWFAKKGYATEDNGYILAKYADWPNNIIQPEVARLIESERTERRRQKKCFPLHRYIHHGLSSQAMLFNLVGPLKCSEDWGALKSVFNEHDIAWPDSPITVTFEQEDRTLFNEDSGQPTSLDLVIEGSGRPICVEAKFSEHQFGSCSVFNDGDCDGANPTGQLNSCYLHHIGRKYWSLLEKHGFVQGGIAQNTTCVLATYYQFFREVLYAIEKDGTFMLLVDKRNPTFCRDLETGNGLFFFLRKHVPEKYLHRVQMITVQEVVEALRASEKHSQWIPEFEEKYDITNKRYDAEKMACPSRPFL